MSKLDSRGLFVAAAIFGVAALVAPMTAPYTQSLLYYLVMTGAFALAWSILASFTGYLSFGHMAFFAAGAYVPANIPDVPAVAQLLFSALVGALLGLTFIIPAMRLRGMYFALASLGLGEIALVLALEFRWLSGGPTGKPVMVSIDKLSALTYLAIFSIGLSLLLAWLRKSRLGLQLLALRSDEDAAEAAGIRTRYLKAGALLSSAAATAVVGSTYAWWLRYVDASDLFALHKLVTVVAGAVIGGIATVTGPVLGAMVFGIFGELVWIRYPFLHEMVTGGVIILGVILLPEGIMGTALRSVTRRRATSSRRSVDRVGEDDDPPPTSDEPVGQVDVEERRTV